MELIDSLAISVPLLLTIFGVIIAYQNYKLNKKKDDKANTQEEVNTAKENEIRLVSIEKDVQYIRLSIDNLVDTQKNHEQRINKLEIHCKNNNK